MAAHRPVVLAGGRFKQLPPGDELDTPAKWDALKAPAIAGGTLTIDLATPAGFRVALNQNVTSLSFANVPAGRVIVFTITWVQDATGGRTVTFPANVKADGGGAPVQPAAGANAVTVQSFYTDDGGATVWQAAASASGNDVWACMPIGVPFPIWTHLSGVAVPPTSSAGYRYVKLTAADSYNSGVLTSETVSGSAPLVQATAVISDAGSVLNGQTIRLINTERRVIRAGFSGSVEADASMAHKHRTMLATGSPSDAAGNIDGLEGSATNPSVGGAQTGNYYRSLTGSPSYADGNNGAPRFSNETRMKNVGADFYMRIR